MFKTWKGKWELSVSRNQNVLSQEKEYETNKAFLLTNTASGHVPVGKGMANPGTLENLASNT